MVTSLLSVPQHVESASYGLQDSGLCHDPFWGYMLDDLIDCALDAKDLKFVAHDENSTYNEIVLSSFVMSRSGRAA